MFPSNPCKVSAKRCSVVSHHMFALTAAECDGRGTEKGEKERERGLMIPKLGTAEATKTMK